MTLLKPEEAASRLAISTRHLRDLSTSGEIRYIDIGRGDRVTRRYDDADIAEFIETRRHAKCQSTKDQVRKPTRTTSGSTVIDLQAIQAQRQREKLKKKNSASVNKPKAPRAEQPSH